MPRPLFIVMGFVLGLLGSLSLSFAVESEAPVSENPLTDYYCSQTVQAVGAVLLVDYQTFLSTFFATDTPSSGQLEDGLRFYRYVEDSLWEAYAKGSAVQERSALSVATQSEEDCARVRDQYLQASRFLLERHLLGSAASKPTFKMVDGLKIMNQDLENFTTAFREVFPDLVSSMSSQFQCYLRDCVTR
jgi:hypothetical protein